MTNNFIELSEVLASLDPEYLEHHGIQGQKWGVEHGPPYPLKAGVSSRIKKAAKSVKDRVEPNRQKKAAKKEVKEEKRKQMKPMLQDKINSMSDEELRQKTERLRLENQYRDQKAYANKGRRFLKQSTNDLKTVLAASATITSLGILGKKALTNAPWIVKTVVDAGGVIIRRR